MIVILSGITGAGKSYLKKHIINKLNFKNIVIVTTRAKRIGEVEGVDKHFVTDEEFAKLKREGKISVDFEFLGHKYAYYTEDLLSGENSVTELHYSTIDEFKKIAKGVVAIYIKPNVQMAKKQLKLRCLPKTIEKFRLKEIKEQIKEFEANKSIQEKFDYIISNDYTEESLNNAVDLIKNEEERSYVRI
jgi:guanylate kinase